MVFTSFVAQKGEHGSCPDFGVNSESKSRADSWTQDIKASNISGSHRNSLAGTRNLGVKNVI